MLVPRLGGFFPTKPKQWHNRGFIHPRLPTRAGLTLSLGLGDLQGSGIRVPQEAWLTPGSDGLVPGRRLRAHGPQDTLPGTLLDVPRLGGSGVFS